MSEDKIMRNMKLKLLLIVGLFSCGLVSERIIAETEKNVSAQKTDTISQETEHGRKLVLNGKKVSESELGEFITWKCREYPSGGRTLVEFGKIIVPNDSEKLEKSAKEKISDYQSNIGFVLYEGGDSGDLAFYRRTGINHRWDWGPGGIYSFIIKPGGIGLFYNFSTSKNGTKEKADDVFMCER